jgi:hypothetical protein
VQIQCARSLQGCWREGVSPCDSGCHSAGRAWHLGAASPRQRKGIRAKGSRDALSDAEFQGFGCLPHVPRTLSGDRQRRDEPLQRSEALIKTANAGSSRGTADRREWGPGDRMGSHRVTGQQSPSHHRAGLSPSSRPLCRLRLAERSSGLSLHRCRPSRFRLQVIRSFGHRRFEAVARTPNCCVSAYNL